MNKSSENKYNHIPLASSFNNLWYLGRKDILKYLISKQKFNLPINILEIGPGVGVNIEILQDFGEVDSYFIELINNNKKIKIHEAFRNFEDINKKYDLIIFLDVLEHIEEPVNFIEDVYKLMKDTGIGILSVPAYQSLFSQHDLNLQHFRRYSWSTLGKQLDKKFTITKKIGYNFFLLPIRYIQIKIINTVISDTSVNPFINKVLTTIVKIEVLLIKLKVNLKFGLSLFAVIKKKDA